MRTFSFAVLILLLSAFSIRADSTEGPLQVTIPSGWKVKCDNSKGIQHYELTSPAEKFLLMNFAHVDGLSDAKEISNLMEKSSTNFYESMSRLTKAGGGETTKGEFRSPSFYGEYGESTMKPDFTQALFMFSDGTGMWMGEYVGSNSNWKKALEILKGMRKK